AIEMGAEAGDVGHTIHPHPTLGETVAMAAEVYEGTLTDLYIPKTKSPHLRATTEDPGLGPGVPSCIGGACSGRQGHAHHRALEALLPGDDAVADAVAGDVALDVQAVPLVAGEQAEVVGEAVLGHDVGAGDATVVVAEVAPVRVQVLALQVQQPA